MSTKPVSISYTADATARGGRDPRVTSGDGCLDVAVASPVQLGGSGVGSNPEQLVAAGWAACFRSALGVIAHREGADITGATVTAHVGIGPNLDEGYGIAAELLVEMPGRDLTDAQRLADAAHRVCPYSLATRGNIDVTVRAV